MQEPDPSPTQALGVADILQSSVMDLINNALKFIGLAFVFQLISFAITTMITGLPKARTTEPQTAEVLLQNLSVEPKQMVALGLSMLISAMAIAYLTMAAFDVRNGDSIRPANYLAHGLKHLGALAVTTIIILALVAIPAAFAVAMTATNPGLSGLLALFSIVWSFFVVSTFCVVTPAILMEERGLSAMARSAQLSAGYRLPIILLYVAVGIAALIFMALFSTITGVLFAQTLTTTEGDLSPAFWVASILANMVSSAIVVSFSSIVFVNLYGRLVELKSGT